MKASMNMQAFQPKLKEIQEKYKDNKQKMVEEQQKLYKKENINPMAGCLPQILPIIILFALYWIVIQPITYIAKMDNTQIQIEYYMPLVAKSVEMQMEDNSSIGVKLSNGKGITSVINKSDLTDDQKTKIQEGTIGIIDLDDGKAIIDMGYDGFWRLYKNRQVDLINLALHNEIIDKSPIEFHFLGLDIGRSPSEMIGIGNWWYLIFPLLTGLTAWGSNRVMLHGLKFMQNSKKDDSKKKKKKEGDKASPEDKAADMQKNMNTMMKYMPLFTAWITFQFSAALGLYWIISNITQVLQQWYINESIRKPHAAKANAQ